MNIRLPLFLALATAAHANLTDYKNAVGAEASLISYYTFDSSNANDSKGTNHGSPQGSPTYTTGLAGGADRALTLSGTQRVNLGTITDFEFPDGTGTIEAWVKAEWTNTTGANPCIMANRNGTPTRWSLHMGVAKTDGGIWNGGAYLPQAYPVNAGTAWHHAAVVFNGTSTLLYWDGVLLATKAQGLGTTGQPTQLGSSSSTGTAEGWTGKLDEVAFYSNALSTAAIQAHYNAWLLNQTPVFTTQPVSVSSIDGGTTRFQAVASGGTVTYQWKRGAANAPGLSTSSIYTIDPVSLAADNGATFSCVATNANGSTTSDTVTLTVTSPSVGTAYFASAVNAEPSLLAYFPTDGSTPGTVTNAKNGSFNGVINGAAAHDSVTGRVVGVRGVGNTGAGWVGLTKDPSWDFTDGNGTIELFAYQPGAVGAYNPTLFSVRQDGVGVRYSFHMAGGGGAVLFWNGSAVSSLNLPSSGLGRLMHLVFVMNNGQCTCYHNGASIGVFNNPLGATLNLPAQIGSSGPLVQEAFVGWTDDVAVYGDPLPASAALAHYNARLTAGAGAAPVVDTQPLSQTVSEGTNVSFSVILNNAAGAIYRWQKNGVDIPGATTSIVNLTPATLADHNAQFRCIVYNPYGGVSSTIATLTVNDTTPPVFVGAAAPLSTTQVILTFNEAVNLTGSSFTLSTGTVTNVAAGPVPGMVILTVSGLTAGQNYTVTANNVRDLTGNNLVTAGSSFTAAPPPVPAPVELVRPAAEPIGPATRRGPFVFSEIHYHPRDRVDLKNLEFIELYNSQSWAEDLSGFRITGEVNYTFPAGTSIAAGGYLVVAAVPADVQSAYAVTGVLGPWTGALNNSGGQVRLRDGSDGVVFAVDYDSGMPWPVAADGAGHSLVLARPSLGMDDPRAWDLSANLDGSPGVTEPVVANPWRAVVINEVRANASFPGDFIELYNYSAASVDVSGCSLSDDRDIAKYVIPAGTSIPAGGFLGIDTGTLGFGLKAGGDTLYFRAPGSPGRVLDALRFGPQSGTPVIGRWPDGAPVFSRLDEDSMGMPNDPPASKEAVISEIHYAPPAGSAQLPFVEVTNTSGTPLDLSGWRLSGGISYDIPAGTTLADGARLAISAFSGTLNKGRGERLRLEMPAANADGAVTETIYPVIDEVTYGTGGRWGRWSDGGGSSLELKDLRTDGRLAANWADSDEAGESGWVNIENTGVIDNGSGAAVNRLHIMMLGEGECLVDDVEVIPSGGGNIITNGGFESGLAGWVLMGTHDASSLEATGFTGTNSLHVRAAGRGDLAGNRVSVPLTSTPANGSTCTLRAKVKWLRGHPEILLRLNGGGLEATGGILPNTVTPGTAGAANSRAVANAGPAISGVTHLPVLPQTGQAATVYARLDDPDSISLALLRYRIDPSAFVNSVVMSYRGAGIFSADIPAQSTGALAAFSITAYDGAGAVSQFPHDAPSRECLIRWNEPTPAGSLGVYRLWMTEATRSLWAGRPRNSNTPLDVTFIYGNSRIIYNATSQYSGSPFHTGSFSGPTTGVCDYDCNAPGDDRFLGETDFILAGPGTFGSDTSQIREQTIWWLARRIGLPSIHRRFCRVYVNGGLRQTVFEDTQQPNGDWIDEYWPGDNDGNLHKAQDWIEFADNGATFQTDIRAAFTKRTTTGGAHKTAAYRYQWSTRSIEGSANDWTDLTALVDAHNAGASAADPAYLAALDPLVDETSWARALAVQRIAGNWDTWGWSYGKNMYLYKPTRGPWFMTAWDIDFSFGDDGTGNPDPDTATAGLFQNTSNFDGGAPGDVLATKFRTQPAFRRAYWCAFREAVDGPMLAANANARIDAMVAGLAASGIAANATQVGTVKTYIDARRTYILGQLNAVFGATTFALNGSSTIPDADGIVTLTGTAPPGVKTFLINGVAYTPSWTSETAWSLTLTLYSATNNLTVQGLGSTGNVIGSFPLTINVTGPPPLPPVTINEWMADNTSDGNFPDPADGNFEDWFELHNSGATPVNLSGFYLTDTTSIVNQFTIPAGTTIPAGGYLLVWADGETEQNGVTPGQIHTNFKLSAGGEQLVLYSPDGIQVDLINFGIQTTDQSQGRYPDSAAGIVFPVPTPGKRNALTPDIIAIVDAGAGTSAVTFSTEPTHVYQIESSTNLAAWSNWGAPVTAAAATTNVNLPRSDTRRFWRAKIVVP